MNPRHDPLVTAICRHLDAAVDNLDTGTRHRLREMRRAALNAAPGQSRSWRNRLASIGLPARFAAAAAMVLLTLVLTLHERSGIKQAALPEAGPLARIELLASAQPLEFYENLEFIAWYAQTQHDQ